SARSGVRYCTNGGGIETTCASVLREQTPRLDGGGDAIEGGGVRAATEVDAELLSARPHRDERVIHPRPQPLGEHALVPRVALAALRPLEVRRRDAARVCEDALQEGAR